MRVPFQQVTVSGCGSYSLANLLNDDRYIAGIEDLMTGESTECLNKKLRSYNPELWLETIFCTQSLFSRQANRLVDPFLFGVLWENVTDEMKEKGSKPFLVSFKRTDSKNHCILVLQNYKTNNLHIVDSLTEFIKVLTIEEFLSQYWILEVNHFGFKSNKPHDTAMIYKWGLPHLFAEGE